MSGRAFTTFGSSPEQSKLKTGPNKDLYFEISPAHKPVKKKEPEQDVSVLRLVHFTHSPKIDFDTVKLGTVRKRVLRILNPKDDEQQVICEKVPSVDSGFTISELQFSLSPTDYVDVVICWQPSKAGGARETLHWRTNAGVRAQTVLFGTCTDPSANKKKGHAGGGRKPLGAANVNVRLPNAPQRKPLSSSNKENVSKQPTKFNKTVKANALQFSTKTNTQSQVFTFDINKTTENKENVRRQTITKTNVPSDHPKKRVAWKDSLQEDDTQCMLEEYMEEQITFTREEYTECYQETSFKSAESGFPNCDVLSSPVHRMTFDKHEIKRNTQSHFAPMKSDDIVELVSSSPARRETYIAETFKSLDEGKNLPPCNVTGSPSRRETYVKKDSDDLRRSTFSFKQNVVKENPFASPVCERFSGEISTPDPSDGTLLSKRMTMSKVAASCMDLLNQIDDMDSSATTTMLHQTVKEVSPNLSLESKQSTPDRLTADSLNDTDQNFSDSLEFSESKKSDLVETVRQVGTEANPALTMSPLTKPQLERIPEQTYCQTEEAESCQIVPVDQVAQRQDSPEHGDEATMQAGEIEEVDVGIVGHDNVEEVDVGHDNVEEVDVGHDNVEEVDVGHDNVEEVDVGHDNVEEVDVGHDNVEEVDVGHDNVEEVDDRNFSTETVCKETSILSPQHIVNLDIINEYINSTYDKRVHHKSPWVDESSLDHKYITPLPVKTPSLPENTFMCASISEFSFLPGDDPKRCSTGVKPSAPPELVEARARAVAGVKLFSKLDQIEECDKKAKVGLQFIEISPPSKRQASSPLKRPKLCSKPKRIRYEPRPAVKVAINSLKLSNRSSTARASAGPSGRPPVPKKSPGGVRKRRALPSVPVHEAKGVNKTTVRRSVSGNLTSQPVSSSAVRVNKILSASCVNIANERAFTGGAVEQKQGDTFLLETESNISGEIRRKLNRKSSCSDVSKGSSNDLTKRNSFAGVSSESLATAKSQLDLMSQAKRGKSRMHLRKAVTLKTIPIKQSFQNPFISNNMFYDNTWMEKQIAGFTRWLNFILTPPDGEGGSSLASKVEVGGLWALAIKRGGYNVEHKAPTKEKMSLNTYTVRGRLNRLRRYACRHYQSPHIREVIAKLEVAIDEKLLTMRTDRHIHLDVGLKQQFLELLLCYNPLWLSLGIETVFGELISVSLCADVTAITQYIVYRLLTNPELQRKFAHPSVPHSYKQGYGNAVKAFVLKKFLSLVLFLDSAKTAKLIDHDPCLFRLNSTYKSTKDLLLQFARNFLSGVGDLTKHLGYLGYTVHHSQTLLDEFDYAVTNLPTDLRCGVRLVRVAEILTQATIGSLSPSLRMPAVSRLQKIHNIGVALSNFQQCIEGVTLEKEYPVADLVIGNRDTTLGLLWSLIFNVHLTSLIPISSLSKEVSHLRKSLAVRAYYDQTAEEGLHSLTSLKAETSEEALSQSHLFISLLKEWLQYVSAHYGMLVHNMTTSLTDCRGLCYLLHHYHPQLLRQEEINTHTSQTVATDQGADLEVSGEDSFSSLACDNDANQEDRLLRLRNDKANYTLFVNKVLHYSSAPELANIGTPEQEPELSWMCKQRSGAGALTLQLAELGGVPCVVKQCEIVGTVPDEKVMVLLLSHLCSRLLDLSKEIRAARVIQMAWRRRMVTLAMERLKIETSACVVIQRWWQTVLKKLRHTRYSAAAITVQKYWRRRLAVKKLHAMKERKELALKNNAARIIQSTFRQFRIRRLTVRIEAVEVIQRAWLTYSLRKSFISTRYNVTKLQSAVRGWIVRKKYLETRRKIILVQSCVRSHRARKIFNQKKYSAIAIQRWYRFTKLSNATREQYLEFKAVTIKVQTVIRTYLARKRFLRLKSSATVIQSNYRGYVIRRENKKLRAAVHLVETVRCNTLLARCCRDQFLSEKAAVITIQSFVRGFKTRKTLYQHHKNAIIIQRRWRMKLIQREFIKKQKASVIIQKYWRGYTQRKHFCETKSACEIIQRWMRSVIVRKMYARERQAVLLIQRYYRAYQETKRIRFVYKQKKEKAVLIQKCYRAHLVRKHFLKQKEACSLIQKRYREYLNAKSLRNQYTLVRSAVVTIQCKWRATLVMRKDNTYYESLRKSCTVIQMHYRNHLITKSLREEYLAKRKAAVTIQSHVRMMNARKRYRTLTSVRNSSALTIQKNWRRCVCRKHFILQVNAAITVQEYYRGYTERKQYLQKRNSVHVIQKWYRNLMTTRKVKNDYLTVRRSVMTIQKNYRMIQCVRRYSKQRVSAVLIQRSFRGYLITKKIRIEFMSKKNACVVLQAHFRMILARKNYQKKIQAVTKLQSYTRMILARKNYQKKVFAVIKLQSYTRMILARKDYQKKIQAVTKLQSYTRMILSRKDYQKKIQAVTKLQSYTRMILARKDYQKKIQAVTKLQSYTRMILAKKNYQKKVQAVTKLQSYTRMILAKKNYQKKVQAVTKLQSYTRMILARKNFQKKVQAVTKLQSFTRMILARKNYQKKVFAVIKLQSYTRMILARKDYHKKIQAVTKLQSYTRMILAKKNYQKKVQAVTKLQSYTRMILARKNYQKKVQAVTKLQTYTRMILARKSYQKKLQAVTKLQSYTRMILARKNFQKKLFAVTKLQSYTRMILARKNYQKKVQAVTKLQSYTRMILARKNYQKKVHAVTKLQSYTRMILDRKNYQKKVFAVIKLQSYTRMILARKNYQNKVQAVTKLQSYTRMILDRKNYQKKVWAVTKLQSYTSMILSRKNYQKKVFAVTKLQSYTRMILARKNYQKKVFAVTKLQSYTRMILARKNYQKRVQAVTKLQSYTRMILARKNFQKKVQAVTKLQSFTRMILARKNYQKKVFAVIKLQSYTRMILARKNYQKKVFAVTKLQSYTRMILARKNYQKKIQAVTKLQSYTRMILAWKNYQKRVQAVTKLQSYTRMILARKNFQKKVQAVTKLQSFTRMILARKNYQKKVFAVIKLQSYTRMILARKNYQKKVFAVTKLQSYTRMILARKNYQKKVQAVTKLQSYTRMILASKNYQKKVQAVTKLQSYTRMILARKSYQKKVQAVTKLQSYTRMILARKNYQKKVFAVTKLQSYTRMILVRAALLQRHIAATVIQSNVRCFLQRREYALQRKAAVEIQNYYRGYKLMQHTRLKFEATVCAAVTLQAAYRGHLCRRIQKNKKESAITIQKQWRMYHQRQRYLHTLKMVVRVQKRVRRVQGMRREREAHLVMQKHEEQVQRNASALTIQRYWRGCAERKVYLSTLHSVRTLQARWRAFCCMQRDRNLYHKTRGATLLLQACYRGYSVRREMKRRNLAATLIQSHYRGYVCRRSFTVTMRAVVTLQTHWRGAVLALRAREHFIYMRRAAVVVQSAWRGRQERLLVTSKRNKALVIRQESIDAFRRSRSARVIQKWWRLCRVLVIGRRNVAKVITIQTYWREYRKRIIIKKRRIAAATLIQAVWRGYTIRNFSNKKFSLCGSVLRLLNEPQLKRLTMVKQRLHEATENANTKNSMGQRTENGIAMLARSRDLHAILQAVVELEAGTRLSSKCCQLVASAKSLKILLRVAEKANRSLPYIQILTYVVTIVINLVKCPETYNDIVKCEGLLPVLVNICTMHYEKASVLLSKSCTALYLLSVAKENNKVTVPSSIKTDMSKLLDLMKRKAATRSRGKKFLPLPSHRLPSPSPHYHLVRGAHEFTDPMDAMVTLTAFWQK